MLLHTRVYSSSPPLYTGKPYRTAPYREFNRGAASQSTQGQSPLLPWQRSHTDSIRAHRLNQTAISWHKGAVNRSITSRNEGTLLKNRTEFLQKQRQKLSARCCAKTLSSPTVLLLHKQIQNKPKLNTRFFQTPQVRAWKFHFTVLSAT